MSESDKQHLLSGGQPTYVQQPPPQVYYPQQSPQPVYTTAPPPVSSGDAHHHHHHHAPHFGVLPQNHVCQWCGVQGVTHISHTPGGLTFLASGACLLLGGWMGCFLIPCCIDELKDVEHFCSSCHQQVGVYTRL